MAVGDATEYGWYCLGLRLSHLCACCAHVRCARANLQLHRPRLLPTRGHATCTSRVESRVVVSASPSRAVKRTVDSFTMEPTAPLVSLRPGERGRWESRSQRATLWSLHRTLGYIWRRRLRGAAHDTGRTRRTADLLVSTRGRAALAPFFPMTQQKKITRARHTSSAVCHTRHALDRHEQSHTADSTHRKDERARRKRAHAGRRCCLSTTRKHAGQRTRCAPRSSRQLSPAADLPTPSRPLDRRSAGKHASRMHAFGRRRGAVGHRRIAYGHTRCA